MKKFFKGIVELICRALFAIITSPFWIPLLLMVTMFFLVGFVVDCAFHNFDFAWNRLVKEIKDDED